MSARPRRSKRPQSPDRSSCAGHRVGLASLVAVHRRIGHSSDGPPSGHGPSGLPLLNCLQSALGGACASARRPVKGDAEVEFPRFQVSPINSPHCLTCSLTGARPVLAFRRVGGGDRARRGCRCHGRRADSSQTLAPSCQRTARLKVVIRRWRGDQVASGQLLGEVMVEKASGEVLAHGCCLGSANLAKGSAYPSA
jgi:hypothetical protein